MGVFVVVAGGLWAFDHLGPGGRRAPLPPRSSPASAPALLRRYVPRLQYAKGEGSFATDVRAFTDRAVVRRSGFVAGRSVDPGLLRPGDALDGPSSGVVERGDVAYGHVARDADGRTWLQYWFFSTDNLQDRGVVRTGRHEGDWEFVQLGLSGARPVVADYAQHAWAEGCGWSSLEHDGTHPVVYVAHGSHASYPRAGEHDRPFPDPTDVADGRGRAVVPRVVAITDDTPRWVAWPGRWGGSRAHALIPGEEPSPPGPRFQSRHAWQRPSAFHTAARACGSGAPPRPAVADAALAAPPTLLLALLLVPLRRRRGD